MRLLANRISAHRISVAGRWLRAMLAAAVVLGFAKGAPAQHNCSATGVIGGEKFALSNCAVALLDDEHSVTLWFNDSPITPKEAEEFQNSAYAKSSKDGRERTMLLVAFCPGGGKTAAAPAAIRSIDLGINHAKAPMLGAQWVVKPPKEFKVHQISGNIEPGGRLAGKITGSRTSDGRPYSWDLQFDVKLPEKSAASGVMCGM